MTNNLCKTYVYFKLSGDDFDPNIITKKLKIKPTKYWKKGDKGTYIDKMKYSAWEICTEKGKEYILIDKLTKQIVKKLNNKIDLINDIKKELKLNSVLEIVLYIDRNPKETTPALGFDNTIIDFLHKTNTVVDVDIYRFDSRKKD